MRIWIISAFTVLISAVSALQWEVNDLRSKMLSMDNASAAIAKFERDLAAQAIAARNIAGAQDAARRAAIDQGLNALPTGSFRKPLYWQDTAPKNP